MGKLFDKASSGADRIPLQDRRTVGKLQRLLDNVVEWRGQGVIVCNFYDETAPDYLKENKTGIKYAVCERIRTLSGEQAFMDITSLHLLEKTALAVM